MINCVEMFDGVEIETLLPDGARVDVEDYAEYGFYAWIAIVNVPGSDELGGVRLVGGTSGGWPDYVVELAAKIAGMVGGGTSMVIMTDDEQHYLLVDSGDGWKVKMRAHVCC